MSDRRGDGTPFVPHRNLAHRTTGQSKAGGGAPAPGQASATRYNGAGDQPVFDEQAADARAARAQQEAQQVAREAKEQARIQHEARQQAQHRARQQATEPPARTEQPAHKREERPAEESQTQRLQAQGREDQRPEAQHSEDRRPGADPEDTQEHRPVSGDDERDAEQTSPIAMAAAAVGAAKERIMGPRDNSDKTHEREQEARQPQWQQSREVPPSVVASQQTVYPGNRPVMRPVTRRARLRLTRIDPWSVMKTSFLLSIAFGIMCVVAVFVIWSVLGAANVFGSVNSTIADVLDINFSIEDYVGIDRVMPIAILISVVNVILITALCTLGSFLYNLAASLLGGLEVTLAEDQK